MMIKDGIYDVQVQTNYRKSAIMNKETLYIKISIKLGNSNQKLLLWYQVLGPVQQEINLRLFLGIIFLISKPNFVHFQ